MKLGRGWLVLLSGLPQHHLPEFHVARDRETDGRVLLLRFYEARVFCDSRLLNHILLLFIGFIGRSTLIMDESECV